MRKIRINVFEDDPTNLRLFTAIMTSRGYEVHAYDRAVVCPVYKAEAVACGRKKPCADIILTDNQMPGLTGIEMLLEQALRGCRVDTRNIAVVSADLDGPQRKTIAGLGCVVFNKPFRLQDLVAWLDDCERRIDLSAPLGIIRKNDRCPAAFELEFATDAGDGFHTGTALNYSVSGLCLRTDSPLGEGQTIEIRSGLPNGCKTASVCWVDRTEGESCLAGVSCR